MPTKKKKTTTRRIATRTKKTIKRRAATPKTKRKRATPKMKTKKESQAPQQYKCEKCGAVFTDPEMLEKHKKTHISAGMAGQPSEGGGGEGLLQGQPRTPPSSPPPEPMPPAEGPQPG